MLYNMPGGFDAANMDDVAQWVMSDRRIVGFKDSSGKEDIFIRLLLFARTQP
jgi:dihydrodipicolinate synthase/N-acetylneuraminate lyase